MSIPKKPIRNRQYVNTESSMNKNAATITEAEDDLDFKSEANHSSEDYSVQSDELLSDEELLQRYRGSLASNILPCPPEIPGFHTCWVVDKSQNIYDTVEHRQRQGYVIVKSDEVASFLSPSNRSGQFEGCVSFNELILMKIPNRLYQLYMKESHHTQPLEQERVIKEHIMQMPDKEGQNLARDTHEMTGINKLGQKRKEPIFH